jgi:glyoxylase I family protein
MHGTNPVLNGGGFHHVAIKVSDFDRSVALYRDALGMREKIRWGEGDKRAIMLDTGAGSYLEIFAGGKPRPPVSETSADGTIIHFALRVKDLKTVVARVQAAGFTFSIPFKHVDIASTPGPTPVDIAFFSGPDGEVIELFENDLT